MLGVVIPSDGTSAGDLELCIDAIQQYKSAYSFL